MEQGSRMLVDYIADLKLNGASENEVKKGFYRYIEELARKKRIPLHGSFELTPFCNLDCKMCYVHLSNSQFNIDSLISTKDWKEIIKEAHEAGMLYATLTGGECLTYPGFDEIYFFMRDIGIVPSILTNGLLLDQERIDFFKRYPPTRIQVTLYGSSDDAYEKVTGKRVFHTIYRNLERVRDAKLKITLTLTPSKYMYDDIRPLVEAAESLHIPYGVNADLLPPRKETGRVLNDLGIDQYFEIYRYMKELRHENLEPVDPIELPDVSHIGESRLGFQCGGGRSGFVIQYNGKMSPCPSMPELATEPFQEGFATAWNRLNDLVSNYPMPAECTKCAYQGRCLYCPAAHKNAPVFGHCDPRICERTKRLVQEGFVPAPER